MAKQPKPYVIKYVEDPIEHWIITTPLGGIDVAVDAIHAITKAVHMAANEEPGMDPISIRIAWLETPDGFEPPSLEDVPDEELELDSVN